MESELGRGGMGVVLRARHLHLGESVAIKVLHDTVASSPEATARIEREARAMARLKTKHVARVLDVARMPSGSTALVLELLRGEDLRAYLRAAGQLPPQEAVELLLDACDGMRAAHALGIVHRDLKPENLFLAVDDGGTRVLKVLDFGIAKVAESGQESDAAALTAGAVLLGSVAYMSPEQIRTPAAVDARTDVWALGVVLFEMLTGRTPFTGDTSAAVIASIASEDPRFEEAEVRRLPAVLTRIVLDCLEKSPERRIQTIESLAERLRAWAAAPSRAAKQRAAWLLSALAVLPISALVLSRVTSGRTAPSAGLDAETVRVIEPAPVPISDAADDGGERAPPTRSAAPLGEATTTPSATAHKPIVAARAAARPSAEPPPKPTVSLSPVDVAIERRK